MKYEDLPAISAAELQTTREWLGLSVKWIAERLVMNERRIIRMEAGQEPNIPTPIITLLDDILAETRDIVDRMIGVYRRKAKANPDEPLIIKTWRTDLLYKESGGKYPSRWHRHVCARVVESVPSAVLEYFDPAEVAGVNIGERLTGTVSNITGFGAFVQFTPEMSGLIHISEVVPGKRIEDINDYLSVGEQVDVEVINVDTKGRVFLRPITDE